MTWLKQDTKLFPQFDLRLVMLVPITNVNESGFWPTPNCPNGGRVVPKDAIWSGRRAAYKADGKKIQVGLESAVRMWPTPRHTDWKDPKGRTGNRSEESRKKAGWTLSEAVRMWPTPKGSPSGPDYARANRPNSGGDDLATAVARDASGSENGGPLNPDWEEWLMGWPIGWTDLRPLETDKFRQWLQQFGDC